MNPVSKFYRSLPDCCKRSNAASALPHRLDHLCKRSALLGRLAGRFCSLRPAACLCPIWTTDFLQSSFSALQHSSSPLVPVSCFPPIPSLSLLSSLSRSPLRARGLVRFFFPRRIVRLEHLESADGNLQIFLLRLFLPFFFLRLPRLVAVCLAPKPNLSGASNEDASTPLSTRSRRDDRSSVESSSFFGGSSVPAGFLQRTYTQQTRPQFTDGAEDTENTAKGSSHSQYTRPKTVGVKELQSHPGGYNI